MLERFGYIIPWVLVAVLGLLVLSIFLMHRTLLEGFDDTSTPPPQVSSAQRAQAISNMKAAASGNTNKLTDDKITEINTFLLNAMTSMLTIYKTLPDGINDVLGKAIDITDDTCYIVKMIEAKYIKKPLDTDDKKKDSYKTQTRTKRFNMEENQFLSKNRSKDGTKGQMLECFVGRSDISGSDMSGADMSGAVMRSADMSGADMSGAKLTDMSGYTFGKQTTVATVSTDLSGAMLKKHAYEDKQIGLVKVELLNWQAKVQAIANGKDYLFLVTKLKKVPLTAQFGSEFINKNRAAIVEGYQNPNYKFPVPYTDAQLDKTQKDHLEVLKAANMLLTNISNDLGVTFSTAQTSHNQLLTDYKTIDPSYSP